MDLAKPELVAIIQEVERRNYTAALDAYRDHFLRKVQRVPVLHIVPPSANGVQSSPFLADDLSRNIVVDLSNYSTYGVDATRFTPGIIHWTDTGTGDTPALVLARSRVKVGMMQWSLLDTYRETGRPELLAQSYRHYLAYDVPKHLPLTCVCHIALGLQARVR